MRYVEVKNSPRLKGSIKIPGSKNSSLALLAACCLGDEPVILENIPNIRDIKIICELGKELGLTIIQEGDKVIVDPTKIYNANLEPQKSSAFRASYYFVGALLQKFKKVSCGHPGGDNFGERPIDQHIKGFEALGAKYKAYDNYYVFEADRLIGADIYFDKLTFGGTINLMLAAVKAEGKTTIHNAAMDPEIIDVAELLNKMGARIDGAGTNTIIINGVKELHGCTHRAIADRLIAAAFLMAVGAVGGVATISGVEPNHLTACIQKLKEAGVNIECKKDFIRVSRSKKLKAIDVEAGMYPEFVTDMQQPLTAMLAIADGISMVTDKVYPKRFGHCKQLQKMGAKILLEENKAIIYGNSKLKGTLVEASDVRAGICLLIAGMIARGTTYISGVEHIERGYADIIKDLIDLGANIRIIEDIQVKKNISILKEERLVESDAFQIKLMNL